MVRTTLTLNAQGLRRFGLAPGAGVKQVVLPEHDDGSILEMEKPLLPLQASFAREFAQDWVDAWNSHDLERILNHYDEEAVLTSPVALKLLNGDGTVRGKAALREYFLRGVQAYPDLHFDLIDSLWGTETVVVYYVNNVRGRKTAEVMLLNPAGKICRVWANYDL